MRIEKISKDDILCSTDSRGTSYYKVLKVNRVTIDVLCENENRARMRAELFDRKITYPVAAFAKAHRRPPMTDAIAASKVVWRRINGEPFEYAIQRGEHGDEFVKLLDGSCLRRPALASAGDEVAVEELAQEIEPRAFIISNTKRFEVKERQVLARERARALLSKFHIHKRAEG